MPTLGATSTLVRWLADAPEASSDGTSPCSDNDFEAAFLHQMQQDPGQQMPCLGTQIVPPSSWT